MNDEEMIQEFSWWIDEKWIYGDECQIKDE